MALCHVIYVAARPMGGGGFANWVGRQGQDRGNAQNTTGSKTAARTGVCLGVDGADE